MWIGGCGYVGFGLGKVGVGMVGVDQPRWVWVCGMWIGQGRCGHGGCGLAKVGVGVGVGMLGVDRPRWVWVCRNGEWVICVDG